MKQRSIIGALLAGALLFATACGDDDGSSSGDDMLDDDTADDMNQDDDTDDTPSSDDDDTDPGDDSSADDTSTDDTSDDPSPDDTDDSSPDDMSDDMDADDDAPADTTLCTKYGGPDVVASVVQNQVIGAIAGDCRVNTFFTSLTEDAFTRVGECLTIQVQELFGCEGYVYAGSEASNGLPCRSMREAHLGLAITTGDFDALIEDVVAGLSEAGVEDEDIAAAAPALLGMQDDIVEEADDMDPSMSQCMLPDAGVPDEMDAGADPEMEAGADDQTDAASEASLCTKYGGPESVASVVQNQVIGAIAGDCRVNSFFTSLSQDSFTRVSDCLTLQVQELFGCEGFVYAGGEASNGLPCRSMTDAHMGLQISKGDFDALIEDVVAGLTEAGVEDEDIAAAAPALLGMEADIVEQADETDHTQDMCMLDDEGAAQ